MKTAGPKIAPPRSWGHSIVHTACPLDCPDCCSLAVTVERGRIQKIDGSNAAVSTDQLSAEQGRENSSCTVPPRLGASAPDRGSFASRYFTPFSTPGFADRVRESQQRLVPRT